MRYKIMVPDWKTKQQQTQIIIVEKKIVAIMYMK